MLLVIAAASVSIPLLLNQALAYVKKAVELDPLSLRYLTGLAEAELALERKDQKTFGGSARHAAASGFRA